MNIGIIGLGRMGLGIAQRLLDKKFSVYGYDHNEDALTSLKECGGTPTSLQNLIESSSVIWIMLPAGQLIDEMLSCIKHYANTKTIIIDGGNSFYKDSIRRSAWCAEHDFIYLDCGTSGGLHGQEAGFSLMIGGDKEAYKKVESLFAALAMHNGYLYCGPSGAGHYVKMIHNGIEYALLQSYAEGLQLLKEGEYSDLNLAAITGVWQHGSIIRSWINELFHRVLVRDQDLQAIRGIIGGGQTGSWMQEVARQMHI